jgi:hypothetical protein
MVLLKPNCSEQVAVCAICSKEINQIKSYAMQRHYKTREQEIQAIYGNPVTRKTRLGKVKNELACFVIGKHRKPFSDGEFIKSLVLVVEPENRLFRDMPLSNDTVQRKIQELCIFIRNEIAQCVKKSPFFSLFGLN